MKCSQCANSAQFVCSLCPGGAEDVNAAKYCSEACQRDHWPIHRLSHTQQQQHSSSEKDNQMHSKQQQQQHHQQQQYHQDSRPASSAASTGSASPIINRQHSTNSTKKRKRPFALNMDTIDDLKYYLSQIYKILKPVLACIFFAIMWVKLLNPPAQYWSGAHVLQPPDIYALNFGGGNVNSSISGTVANPNNESAEQQHQDLLMALKTLGSVVGATLLIFVLFYYNCMKILYGIFGFIILGVLGLFGYYISSMLLWLYNVPFDYISFFFFLWNFSAVGIIAVFWKGPLWLQQVYLVLMSSMMAYMLTNPSIPPITSWILLALLAVWDLIAVLCPYGPLRLLIETSKNQNREIPALLYTAGPTTMMATPDTTRTNNNNNKRSEPESEETEMKVIHKKKSNTNQVDNNSGPSSPTSAVNDEEAGPPRRQQQRQVDIQDDDEDDEQDDGGMKLGLGDFVFYSVLASRAALSDWVPTTAVTIGLLTGLNFTIFLLVIWQKALPALPFSIAFGLLFYFTTGLCLVPFVNNLSTLPGFPLYQQDAESWLVVGQVGGSGMIYV
ncbi:Presenilin-domain-containing protein [Obelidium mucronatum]|nr:Presenilin-domain-containing protein [Obelidium mucronatum]